MNQRVLISITGNMVELKVEKMSFFYDEIFTLKPAARAIPPPERSKIFHGKLSFMVFQVIR